ncbi:putative mismatched base pair and cruciform DNA recognition protein [Lyophyllum shimeji]|uniref:Mismatched base pair and cruciform DNA recognition protein n=1 Tax=Lyophyllum shimeji TaxID=47721 RepID=A0A9P3PUU7_LYOSH|nr:putative mismatched base pair and cruciform DNA recognition protein [Lyophyllum shimeji]
MEHSSDRTRAMSSELESTPPLTSASNTPASGDASKSSGQYHSAKGNVVESVGNLTGAPSWQQSGQQERAAGEAEYNAARSRSYAEGMRDRIGGTKDSVVGAITGNRAKEVQGKMRRGKGDAQREINEDINKTLARKY